MKMGIALGEYFGIGPEILLKTFASLKNDFPPSIIYGKDEILDQKAKELGVLPFWRKDPFQLVETYSSPVQKEDQKSRAKYVLSTLDQAIEDASRGKITGIITCPIDKSVIKSVIPSFTGHTEYLEEKTKTPKTVMMLSNGEFNIALLTNHVSLREVSKKITSSAMEEVIQTAYSSFSKYFSVARPKSAVLGINPHAGELDPESEEEGIFTPVIEKLQKKGLDLHGPFPADSFFAKARNQGWDIVFSPYHDQGLVAAKYNGLQNVINITLGMPFLRISPGHGTAYDIVGQNIADHRSFQRAIVVLKKRTLKTG